MSNVVFKIVGLLYTVLSYLSLLFSTFIAAGFFTVVKLDLGWLLSFVLSWLLFFTLQFLIQIILINNVLFRLYLRQVVPKFWSEDKVGFLGVGDETVKWCWEELEKIEVHTNDKGPFKEDLFYILFFKGNEESIVIPHMTRNSDGFVQEVFNRFENVDLEQLCLAMGSCQNNRFTIWEGKNDKIAL